jgi:hypothetical protein
VTAILLTNMVGASRLMERDEFGTTSYQRLHRADWNDHLHGAFGP